MSTFYAKIMYYLMAVGKVEPWGGVPATAPPPTISWSKFFFQVKSENIQFFHVKNILDLSLFIEQEISDKK